MEEKSKRRLDIIAYSLFALLFIFCCAITVGYVLSYNFLSLNIYGIMIINAISVGAYLWYTHGFQEDGEDHPWWFKLIIFLLVSTLVIFLYVFGSIYNLVSVIKETK